MMARTINGFTLAAALLATTGSSALAAIGESGRSWTLRDIVTAPEVTELALSQDQRRALYSVEAADIEAGRPRSALRLVDLTDGSQRELLRANSVKLLKHIPGSDDWSGLLDIGAGIQLYRIDHKGKVRPLMVNPATVMVGQADMALPSINLAPPHRVGVLAYDWSPDGKWLWYSLLKPRPSNASVKFDADVTAERNRRRSQIDADIEFHLRGPDGRDTVVMTRPTSDAMAFYYGGNIIWRGDEIQFRVEVKDGTAGSTYETRVWNKAKGIMRTLASERNSMTIWMLKGPRGGHLATTGVGEHYDLVESFADGKQHSYGQVDYNIGDPRSAGIRLAADGKSVVLGTRSIANPHYGLALIEDGRVRTIKSDDSLTRCDFGAKLAMGICVREGMTRPPELVRVDLKRNHVERIAPVSPSHEEIAPFIIRPRTWVNRLGYTATGFVIFPRGYVAGRRYPAIVITHGSDADERFANIGFQWNYPVQLFAERGYVVLAINDPGPRQNTELWAVFQAWLRGSGPPGPEEMQRLGWVNGVYSFEDAVKEMATEGLVDPEHVGIAGFSRGSQMVNVTLTHSKLFRAASGGDGSFLEPFSYPVSHSSDDVIFGGSPFGKNIVHYRRFSPSLNADKACTPLLQQMALPLPGALDVYQALRDHNVPTQISYYPGESAASDETHAFHIPSNRLLAMRENLAWFDYWLLGRRDADAPFPERLDLWDKMASDSKRPCQSSTSKLEP